MTNRAFTLQCSVPLVAERAEAIDPAEGMQHAKPTIRMGEVQGLRLRGLQSDTYHRRLASSAATYAKNCRKEAKRPPAWQPPGNRLKEPASA